MSRATIRRLAVLRVERDALPNLVAGTMLAAAVILTVVAGENLTVGSTVWLPAESVAPGR
jgi:predicted anti-sigma-YlaC factor YlaD